MSWADTIRGYLPGQSAKEEPASSDGTRQLTAAEVLAHPEYPHVNWDLKPSKREKIEVAKGRGGPFKLAYELHGHGPNKVLRNGLNLRSKF